MISLKLNGIIRRCLSTTAQNVKRDGLSEKIVQKLNDKFGTSLFHCEVRNHSWRKNEPLGSEKFLEIIVVSSEFESVKKEKRQESIKKLLANELKDCQGVKLKLLEPCRWYDSNQRGLKLDTIYANPPVFNGNLEQIAHQYYRKNPETDAAKKDTQ